MKVKMDTFNLKHVLYHPKYGTAIITIMTDLIYKQNKY